MDRYFCGWYFRCQSDLHTIAIIASCHKSGHSKSCEIQFVTDTDAYHTQFPYSCFEKTNHFIKIANNYFGPDGIRLNIQNPGLCVDGNIHFGPFTKIHYDIMGPFRFFPFMQCRHSVYSMYHTVNGNMTINDKTYSFRDSVGYIEGDRGRSFPKEYVWTQCSFPGGSLMLSIADIPLGVFHFTGVIGILYLGGEEYRLASYLGAKILKISPHEIIVRQRSYTFIINPGGMPGYPLHAPVSGAMGRTIHEHPSCKVSYRFEKNGQILLELDAHNAAFEYEY